MATACLAPLLHAFLGWQSRRMAVAWDIDTDRQTILLKSTDQALAADLETYNLVLARDLGLIDFG
ncbi:MAG: hypothetical protein ACJAYE_002170 [Candidatus Azotimanducaceae bacterium]|jgi:hypothetical protein